MKEKKNRVYIVCTSERSSKQHTATKVPFQLPARAQTHTPSRLHRAAARSFHRRPVVVWWNSRRPTREAGRGSPVAAVASSRPPARPGAADRHWGADVCTRCRTLIISIMAALITYILLLPHPTLPASSPSLTRPPLGKEAKPTARAFSPLPPPPSFVHFFNNHGKTCVCRGVEK